MKAIMILSVWMMVPIAFVFVVFDVAKAAVEDKLESMLKEKNT